MDRTRDRLILLFNGGGWGGGRAYWSTSSAAGGWRTSSSSFMTTAIGGGDGDGAGCSTPADRRQSRPACRSTDAISAPVGRTIPDEKHRVTGSRKLLPPYVRRSSTRRCDVRRSTVIRIGVRPTHDDCGDGDNNGLRTADARYDYNIIVGRRSRRRRRVRGCVRSRRASLAVKRHHRLLSSRILVARAR